MKTLLLAWLAILLCCPSGFAQGSGQDSLPALRFAMRDPALPNVAIVTTGGTIAEKSGPKGGGAVPAVAGAELVRSVPGLAELANVGVLEFSNMDSSQMSPEVWARLARVVAGLLERRDVAGVVVTHGTDTMAEAAFFLDLVHDSPKAVVFTGAMNDASSPFPDGPGNLLDAVTLAGSDLARGWGVSVLLNHYVNAARDVRKTHTTNVQTFQSGEKGYLGYVFQGQVRRFHDRAARTPLPLPRHLPKVAYLAAYAGDDGSLVRQAVAGGAQGLVVAGLGAGNVNAATFAAIREALDKGVVVVIAPAVPQGAVAPLYGGPGGGRTLADHGCILAGDLDGHKARILLQLGLARHGQNARALKDLFLP
ncbi:MAG: asparaginase [Desulfovibrio sp.]